MLRIMKSTKPKSCCSLTQNHQTKTPSRSGDTKHFTHPKKPLPQNFLKIKSKTKKHTNHTPQGIAKQIRGAIRIGNARFITLAQANLRKKAFVFILFVCIETQASNLFILPCKPRANQT